MSKIVEQYENIKKKIWKHCNKDNNEKVEDKTSKKWRCIEKQGKYNELRIYISYYDDNNFYKNNENYYDYTIYDKNHGKDLTIIMASDNTYEFYTEGFSTHFLLLNKNEIII